MRKSDHIQITVKYKYCELDAAHNYGITWIIVKGI